MANTPVFSTIVSAAQIRMGSHWLQQPQVAFTGKGGALCVVETSAAAAHQCTEALARHGAVLLAAQALLAPNAVAASNGSMCDLTVYVKHRASGEDDTRIEVRGRCIEMRIGTAWKAPTGEWWAMYKCPNGDVVAPIGPSGHTAVHTSGFDSCAKFFSHGKIPALVSPHTTDDGDCHPTPRAFNNDVDPVFWTHAVPIVPATDDEPDCVLSDEINATLDEIVNSMQQ